MRFLCRNPTRSPYWESEEDLLTALIGVGKVMIGKYTQSLLHNKRKRFLEPYSSWEKILPPTPSPPAPILSTGEKRIVNRGQEQGRRLGMVQPQKRAGDRGGGELYPCRTTPRHRPTKKMDTLSQDYRKLPSPHPTTTRLQYKNNGSELKELRDTDFLNEHRGAPRRGEKTPGEGEVSDT